MGAYAWFAEATARQYGETLNWVPSDWVISNATTSALAVFIIGGGAMLVGELVGRTLRWVLKK